MHNSRVMKTGSAGGAGKQRQLRGSVKCSSEGCSRTATTRGMCGMHYNQWRKSGAAPEMPGCSVDDCNRIVVGRGLCGKHYQRWQKHGDPLTVQHIQGDDEARFWSHVDKDGPVPERKPELGPCWLWTGCVNHRGYGRFSIPDGSGGHREVPAARWICDFTHGVMAVKEEPDHLCLNTSCVNLAHLEVVTQRENILRSSGPAAINSRKTHCIHGHEFTPGNTYIHVKRDGSVRRSCRTCMRIKDQRYRERKRAV